MQVERGEFGTGMKKVSLLDDGQFDSVSIVQNYVNKYNMIKK